jgi:hypothetical protein
MGHITFQFMVMMLMYWTKNVNTRNKNAKFPLDSIKGVGVEVNVEKAKYTYFVVSSPDYRIES